MKRLNVLLGMLEDIMNFKDYLGIYIYWAIGAIVCIIGYFRY